MNTTLDIPGIEELLTAIGGKKYKPGHYPDNLPRMQIGRCFDACASLAMVHTEYRYVEGLARPAHQTEWILHAWLTDGKHALDPTWLAIYDDGHQVLLPVEYIGIEMDITNVAQFMNATGYQGVIANRWRNPELAAKAIGLNGN